MNCDGRRRKRRRKEIDKVIAIRDWKRRVIRCLLYVTDDISRKSLKACNEKQPPRLKHTPISFRLTRFRGARNGTHFVPALTKLTALKVGTGSLIFGQGDSTLKRNGRC